jgi:RNA polymerase sigma-70 factor (ECF subfamily)
MSALVAEGYGQLVRYASRRLRALDVPSAWADAEDVVQNALASVFAHGHSVEELRPYVFTVIKNEAWNAARRYRSGLGYGARNPDVQLEAAGAATDPCGMAVLRLDLEAALSALPQQQRTAVLATKALGLTPAETAQAMGKTPGTVATHVSRAVATLKSALGALVLVLSGRAGYFVYTLLTGRRSVDPAAGGLNSALDAAFGPRQTLMWILGALAVALVFLWLGTATLRWLRRWSHITRKHTFHEWLKESAVYRERKQRRNTEIRAQQNQHAVTASLRWSSDKGWLDRSKVAAEPPGGASMSASAEPGFLELR